MSVRNFPPCPASLKQIQHYLKTAAEHEDRDIIISYWCRLYALQLGLKIDRSSQEAKKLLSHLMDWLERTKAEHSENESISNDIPAQAHLENYAFRLFVWADSQDRSGIFNRNVVKAFYTAGLIYDVLDTFGEVSEDVMQNRKYAKWKAAYIHNCLKNGETPIAGPLSESQNEPSSSASTPFLNKYRGSHVSSIAFTDSVSGKQTQTASVFPTDSALKDLSAADGLANRTPEANELRTDKDFSANSSEAGTSSTNVQLTPEQLNKAQKYCKWAASALNYEDVPTAVQNLQKALQLLTKGSEE